MREIRAFASVSEDSKIVLASSCATASVAMIVTIPFLARLACKET